jgi:diaminopimelate epimerase
MADYYKYHGLGNDYIVIDPNTLGFDFHPNSESIKLICHRNLGIGSDGILFGPIIEGKKITFKIFNPDGSEAEKSGNGIRIFALYLVDSGYVKENSFDLYTKSGKVEIELIDIKSNIIKVSMGKYSFVSNDIPVLLDQREIINHEINLLGKKEIINCVNIGNPHCVLVKNSISEILCKELGPILENHRLFPNKTNVQFMQILDRSNIKIEIWERGAGYTLASGTSSCAASCVAHKLGLVDQNITVHMQGGTLNVKVCPDELFLIGPVARVSEGHFTKDFIQKILN